MPAWLLPKATKPDTSVPIKLPSTTLLSVPASRISIPAPLLPEIRLPVPAVKPPMVLPAEPFRSLIPLSPLVLALPFKSSAPVTSVPR